MKYADSFIHHFKTESGSRWILLASLGLAIISGASWFCSSHELKKPAEPSAHPLEVRTVPVATDRDSSYIKISGVADPIRRTTLSGRVCARIQGIYVQDGQRVNESTVLARLDTRDLAAHRQQAFAGQGAASTALDVARANLRRMQTLYESGAASKAQLEVAQVVEAQAQAGTMTANAAMDEVNVNFSYAAVLAPFSGKVVQKLAEVGNIVGPAQPLFILEDDSQLRIIAAIGSEDASYLCPEGTVRVRMNDEILSGKVEGVMSSGDTRAPGLRAQVLVNNPGHRLRAGTIGIIEVPRPNIKKPVFLIPKEAIFERGQLTGVFVAEKGTVARLHWVSVGDGLGDRVQILSGLEPGDHIILSPSESLFDGCNVQEASR